MRCARLHPAMVLAIALAGTACGSSTTTARADFIARADALCTDLRHRLDPLPPPTTVADEAVYLSRSIPLNEAALDQLRGLPRPPGDNATITRLLDEFDDVIVKARAAEQPALAGDQTATDVAIKEIGIARDKAGADARAYGLVACGSGPTPAP